MPGTRGASTPRADRLRAMANLVNLSTPLGLLIASAGRARLRSGPGGLILGEGYRLRFPLAGAFTLGNVVITSATFEALRSGHPDLLAHEDRHAWQYVGCLGLPYLLFYTAAMGWSVLRTGDRASANGFERDAGLVAGGYAEHPPRPLLPALRTLLTRRTAP